MSISPNDFVSEEEDPASDLDEISNGAYYQPISAEIDSEEGEEQQWISNGEFQYPSEYNFSPPSSNGFLPQMENGISSLNLKDSGDFRFSGEEHDDDSELERSREASEMAISAAFSEDERRRNAPLTPERSSAIINAMQGISFAGFHPEWADRVLEDQWVDQLRRLREPSSQN